MGGQALVTIMRPNFDRWFSRDTDDSNDENISVYHDPETIPVREIHILLALHSTKY